MKAELIMRPEKTGKSKLEEEKYDHLLNSVQAQTLIQAVEKITVQRLKIKQRIMMKKKI